MNAAHTDEGTVGDEHQDADRYKCKATVVIATQNHPGTESDEARYRDEETANLVFFQKLSGGHDV